MAPEALATAMPALQEDVRKYVPMGKLQAKIHVQKKRKKIGLVQNVIMWKLKLLEVKMPQCCRRIVDVQNLWVVSLEFNSYCMGAFVVGAVLRVAALP